LAVVIFVKIVKDGKPVKGFNDVDKAEYTAKNGWIRAFDFEFEGAVSQSNAHSGSSVQVSGRDYKDVYFTHHLSSATASIHKALIENKDLTIVIHLTRPARGGGNEHKPLAKYTFEGANVTRQKCNASDTSGKPYAEAVFFSFATVNIDSDDDYSEEKTMSEDVGRLSKKK